MHKLITTLLCLLCCAAAWAQNLTIYTFSGAVKVKSISTTVNASKGLAVRPSDILIIPAGGSVSIHDKKSGDIYTSQSVGEITVAKLKFEASRSATSKSRTLLSSMSSNRFGNSATNAGRVYMEKGMVNRSLAIYDPDGDSIAMRPRVLAGYIAGRLLEEKSDDAPLALKFGCNEGGGLFFNLENTLEYPVYFNVLVVSHSAEGKEIQISPLGQPNGSYVVLPRQTMHREHLDSLPFSENHFIVITPCQYDLDGVIEEVNKCLAAKEDRRPAEEIAASVVMLRNPEEKNDGEKLENPKKAEI